MVEIELKVCYEYKCYESNLFYELNAIHQTVCIHPPFCESNPLISRLSHLVHLHLIN